MAKPAEQTPLSALALAELAKEAGVSFQNETLAHIAKIKYKGKQLILVKPTTYMNLSGKAFKYWMDKEKVALENTLTIVDDLALPTSKLRLRASGSDAGHNGLKDIQLTLGTDAYPKLRFGIGNNFAKGQQVDFVLGRWAQTERKLIDLKIEKSVEVIESFATIGLTRTMTFANGLDIKID